jgi:hypothetical protein
MVGLSKWMIVKMRAVRFVVPAMVILGVLTGAAWHLKNSDHDPYEKLSAIGAYQNCRKPAEVYEISSLTFPLTAKIMRHTECLGYENIFIVVWNGPNSDKNVTAAKLLGLVYAENYNSFSSDEKMIFDYIKVDQLSVDDEETYIMFAQLKIEKKKKNSGVRL